MVKISAINEYKPLVGLTILHLANLNNLVLTSQTRISREPPSFSLYKLRGIENNIVLVHRCKVIIVGRGVLVKFLRGEHKMQHGEIFVMMLVLAQMHVSIKSCGQLKIRKP